MFQNSQKKIQSDLIANSNEISPKEINKISRNTKKIGNNSSLDSKLNLNNSKNKTILVKLKKNTKIHNNNSIINIYPRIQIGSKNNKQATQFQTNQKKLPLPKIIQKITQMLQKTKNFTNFLTLKNGK